MKAFSDYRLLGLIKANNAIAFTVLVDRYWERLYKHLHYRIHHEEDAKDNVQEIFISLWNNIDTVTCNENDSLEAYLFTAARYRAIDYFSKPDTVIPYAHALSTVLAYPSAAEADQSVMLRELEQLIQEELNSLPERLQQPYRMSRENHLSIKEIAVNLSLSEQTVKNNISAVLHKLRLKLGQYNSDTTIYLIVALAALKH
jgi:RNA polymerase sigma factor (sigma-70 family)